MARSTAFCLRRLAPYILLSAAGPVVAQEWSSDPLASRGLRVLQMQGCVSCHSLDGSPSAGPSFAGRWGTAVSVRDRDQVGSIRQVLFDRTYLVHSLATPDAELAEGFAPGVMPTFSLSSEQTEAVAATLASLPGPEPTRSDSFWEAGVVIGCLVVFAAFLGWRLRVRNGTPP
jgi:mono/diheme cytochrome c family protein